MEKFEENLECAVFLDNEDKLGRFREDFFLPCDANRSPYIYFVGNSTGLQPRRTPAYVNEELMAWAEKGAEAHFEGKFPWYSYHEFVTASLARLVGAKPIEVVAMNGLSVNLQFMLASFYQPTPKKFKILMEGGSFPSDRYAVSLHTQFRGYDAKNALLEIFPREGESTIRPEDLLELIEKESANLSLILLGNPNYLTGQVFPVDAVAKLAKKHGITFGLDLAHGVGNLELKLHDWGVDFAVWCSYKYLNAGPGAIGGCFVHEKHANDFSRPRLAAWWGHDKVKRFLMAPEFNPMAGAEGYQLSNPPILQLAALRASLELFDEVGIENVIAKRKTLVAYMDWLLSRHPELSLEAITPRDPEQRGAQHSWRIKKNGKQLVEKLKEKGVLCDFRQPDILRAAPVALYNRFEEVFKFVGHLIDATVS